MLKRMPFLARLNGADGLSYKITEHFVSSDIEGRGLASTAAQVPEAIAQQWVVEMGREAILWMVAESLCN